MCIRDRPTTNCAIYGYKKDPEDKDHWLVDEEAAAVVRRIFRLAVEGHGPYEISKMLTAEKVECPGYYLSLIHISATPAAPFAPSSFLRKP